MSGGIVGPQHLSHLASRMYDFWIFLLFPWPFLSLPELKPWTSSQSALKPMFVIIKCHDWKCHPCADGAQSYHLQPDLSLDQHTYVSVSSFQGISISMSNKGFPGGSVVKNLPANAEDMDLIPGLGRSPAEGNGNRLQYSCLGNPTDRGAWQAAVHGVAKSQTRLSLSPDLTPGLTSLSNPSRPAHLSQWHFHSFSHSGQIPDIFSPPPNPCHLIPARWRRPPNWCLCLYTWRLHSVLNKHPEWFFYDHHCFSTHTPRWLPIPLRWRATVLQSCGPSKPPVISRTFFLFLLSFYSPPSSHTGSIASTHQPICLTVLWRLLPVLRILRTLHPAPSKSLSHTWQLWPAGTLQTSHPIFNSTSHLLTGLPDGSAGKESACSPGDKASIPGLGRSPAEGNGNPLLYSCLQNPMDKGAWWAVVHGVAESETIEHINSLLTF